MNARQNALQWLGQNIDDEFKIGIKKLLDSDSAELEDAFYKNLEFGTGGMRGIMGIGSNRVNKYTFGTATQGLANYLKMCFPAEKVKVAVAYDCRNNSSYFADLVSDVLSANGIEVFLFAELRATPQLSHAVRYLKCHSGIVITASHNPSEYNGYKVYWSDGAQIVEPHDRGIIDEVNKVSNIDMIRFTANPELIQRLGSEMDEAFIEAALAQRKTSFTNSHLNIVFTSLHGTSITLMPELLKRAGYKNVNVVDEQAVPDGNFPTVKSPNPEEREALEMALKKATILNADLVIGTDPDSDRIGIAVRNKLGEMVLLNGNQTGVLLTDYLIKNSTLTGNEFIAYTIVSSDMFRKVAEAYGVEAKVCLTGFKHIAALIRKHEGKLKFLGGGEESYGYMVGDFVRDKDAYTSALIFCDLLGELLENGKSAEDYLSDLYRKHGVYHERLLSVTKKGKSGSEEIAAMMQRFRSNPPVTLGGDKVIRLDDLQSGVSLNLMDQHKVEIHLPSSNVLQFYTASGSKVSVRPSGTEPKIKFYFSVRAPWKDGLSADAQQKILDDIVNDIIKDLGL